MPILSRSCRGLAIVMLLGAAAASDAATIAVSPAGDDRNPGTEDRPLATLHQAQIAARKLAGREPVTVVVQDGIYYLSAPLRFTAADSGTPQAPICYQAAKERGAVLSGGRRLHLDWKPFRNGIMQAVVPEDLATEELFVDGERQILARYPDFDPKAKYFNGSAADAISPERAARWADPEGGYLHAMHSALWGGYTWRITGKDAQGNILKEGGWQNNRGGPMHRDIRYVENLFEELDSPGEWYLNRKTHVLYYLPPAGMDLTKVRVEATVLRDLVHFAGDAEAPVRFVSFSGFALRHAARTVMDTREPLLRTDWAIYRGGAILVEGAEDCILADLHLDQVGGNGIFVNRYNRRVAIRGCEINGAGASGICFVGDQKAVRNPLTNYEQNLRIEALDLTPGPLTGDFPADSRVEDCLIRQTGRVEKQSAGVEIDIAQSITVSHCSIYDMPRAGINIGDGAFGGHVIEYCDVFDTVLETGDHGSFNSWGRDRFWTGSVPQINERVKAVPGLPLLDAVKPTILRNNRWRCDHGWDIDLDDGSTNYLIENNLCLNGGIKNREGFHRMVRNNILVNNTFHAHVWPADCQDVFSRNIVFSGYKPVRSTAPWGKELEANFYHIPGRTGISPATTLQGQSGRDATSLMGDAQFVDPSRGDYRVKPGSPVLGLGFENFPMDRFGVMKPALRAVARTPVISRPKVQGPGRDGTQYHWLQATLRNIVGEGEMSAYGTPGQTGLLVIEVAAGSPLAAAGLRKDDVVFHADGAATEEIRNLVSAAKWLKPGKSISLGILRQQQPTNLTVRLPEGPAASLLPVPILP